jgi:DNA-binding transcriptional regulator YiaG
MELVNCPPMRARIQASECVKLHDSGEQVSCMGCQLGPARGAAKDWAAAAPYLYGARPGIAAHIARSKRAARCSAASREVEAMLFGKGKTLRQWRERAKLSQVRLAEMLDVHPREVSRWEATGRVPRKHADKIEAVKRGRR